MVALGRIASVVSHELNTPLANIFLTTDYLTKKLGKRYHEELSVIKNEVDHASHIIRRILSFSRMENLDLRPLNLTDVLNKAVSNVQNNGDSHTISIDNRVRSPLRIKGNAVYLQEAFTNILTNAVEAADPEKKIHQVTIESQWSKKSVTITTQDTGVGIPSDVLGHIFEPFFTTKAAEEGTGLGLYITQWIIQQHKGSILVSSKVGVGTTVSVTFPCISPF